MSARSSSNAKERRQLKPAHVKAPVSKTDPERIKLTLQGQRLRCAELERELNEMRAEIVKTNIEVDHELSNDFSKILTVTTRFVNYSHKINFFQTSFQSGFSEIMFSLQKNILCR